MPEGEMVVFSAHGVAPAVHENAAARQLRTIDATCPLVTKVHVEARRFAAEGYTIVMIGHEGHEEVEGTDRRGARAASSWSRPLDEVDDARGRRSRPGRLHHPDDALGRRDRRDHRRPAGEVPGDRQLQVRRHLLRDDQPPDRGQAAGPRVRPGPRDRLDQLLQLQPPGRGRPRARRRLAPDRQPHPGRGGVARGRRDGRHHLRRQRPRGAGRARWSSFFRERGADDVSELRTVHEDVRFMLPKEIREELAGSGA